VHGGGWIGGSKEGVANYLKVLAGHGYTTVGLEYSTGYGAMYPKPVEQINSALGFLAKNASSYHVDATHINLAGDSAGAQIVSQVALLTTDPTYARDLEISPTLKQNQLSSMLLLSGAYDVGAVDFHGRFSWFLKTVLWAYSGAQDFTKNERFHLVSVTNYVTPAFPPTFVSSGNGDPLEPQAVALSQRLQSIGVPVQTLFFPASYSPPLPHEYQFNLDTPAGQEAMTRMFSFLDGLAKRPR
jgi:acetyl esterase/lipase